MKKVRLNCLVTTVLAAAIAAGCGTVHPQGDYKRAGKLIQERTGSASVYDPDADSLTSQKVRELLADGLTAYEAVRVALLNNRAFQSQFQEIGVSRADLVQSGLLTNPSLSLSGRLPEGGGRVNMSFGLAQEIVDLWQIPVRKRIAKDQLEQTILKVVMSAIDLTAQAKKAYFQVRVLEEREKSAQENLDLLVHAQHLAENRFEAGETSILDVNLVKSNLLEGKMRLESAHRDRLVSRAAFDRVLGLSMDQSDVKLTDPLPTPDAVLEDDALLVKKALDSRIDIRMAALDLDSAEAEIKHQKRSVVTNFSVGVDGERPERRAPRSLKPLPPALQPFTMSASQTLGSTLLQNIQNEAQAVGPNTRDLLRQEFDNARSRKFDKKQTVDLLLGPSLQVTLPIWDQNRAQIAKSKYRYIQKQKDYEEQLLTVVQEIRQASATLRSTDALLKTSLHDAIPLAQANIGTAQRVYEAGEESILALLTAQQTLITQRDASIQLAGDYAAALAELERATGGVLNPQAAAPATNTTR